MQYLLSVITTGPTSAHRRRGGGHRRVQRQLQAEGYWVFAGGLGAPDTATVVDNRGGDAVVTDGPFVESKEYLGRLLDHRGARPRRRAALAADGSKACNRKVEVRPFLWRDAGRARRSPGPTTRSGPGSSPRWPAASATSTSPRRRRPRRSRPPSSGGRADGVPPNPGGWLTTTAQPQGDRPAPSREQARRQAPGRPRCCTTTTRPSRSAPIDDDRLRLVFTCCHPALAMEARVALTLRLLGGLTVAEIARAFLVQEATMAQRITRAKAQDQGGPHPLPGAVGRRPAGAARRRARRRSTSSSTRATWRPAPAPTRSARDLTAEAIRLDRACSAPCCRTTARWPGCSP